MLLFATVALMVVSCTSGKERKIVGLWENDETQYYPEQRPAKYLEFKKDGTVIVDEDVALNYSISDDDLIIKSEWISRVYKIEKMTSSELHLYHNEEGTQYYDKVK